MVSRFDYEMETPPAGGFSHKFGGFFDFLRFFLKFTQNLHNFGNKRPKITIFVSISMFQGMTNSMKEFSASSLHDEIQYGGHFDEKSTI